MAYFHRRGRLTACREGLVRRRLEDLRWRVPDDLPTTAIGRAVIEMLGQATRDDRSGTASPEVDLVVRPGTGRFVGSAECRLLVTADVSPKIARQADVVIDLADRQRGHAAASNGAETDIPEESLRSRIEAAI